MKSLSVLIPTFNDICFSLVRDLQQQAEAIGMDYEIIVGDDGSTSAAALTENRRINSLPHCRLWERSQNCGRAVIRNALANEAQYEWLLFIDSDMTIRRLDFVRRYVQCECEAVAYGGYAVGGAPLPHNLRYRYEKAAEPSHTTEQRQQHPYQDFHTSNFLIRRDLMRAHPFDERFRHYGYEDVLFGKELEQHHIGITHIDNPVSFERFESNEEFLCKTEEGLRTLNTFRHELQGYSRLLTTTAKMPKRPVRWWHKAFGMWVRRRAISGGNLLCFKLYKLGYFLSL